MGKKYEEVIDHIEKHIAENQLKQGDRLPSIRELRERYNCNKATIIRAYRELELNHRVYSIPKGGFYLVEKGAANQGEHDRIDFSEVLPDPKLLPYREFNHCINKAVELYKDTLFSYGDTQGLLSLRKVLAEQFSENQVYTKPEDIFVVSGAQQALSILAKMAFPNNKQKILVEQPSYGLMQELIALSGAKLVGISRNRDGIDLKQLESIFREEDIKFFYTIPRFHNPLGTSLSEKTKRQIARLAEKYDVYIVEDDYLADLETDSRVLPIHYYDLSKRTIYVRSFSKAFMPGIRIGAVVLQENLRKEFSKLKRCDDLNTSVLSQGALEIYLNSGMYKNHTRKTKLAYQRKMDFLREYLKSQKLPEIEIEVPKTGFFVWVKLPDCIDVKLLEKKLCERKVLISPGSYFFIGSNNSENAFRMCVSRLSKGQIETGIGIILEEIQKQLIRQVKTKHST